MRRSARAFPSATFLITAVMLGCGKSDTADGSGTETAGDTVEVATASTMELPVATVPARQGDLVLTISTTGQVASDEVSTLKSEVAAPIARVLVRPGDRVKKGQPLIEFETKLLDIAVQEATAGLERAQVAYRDTYYPDSVVTGRVPTEEQRRNARARAGIGSAEAQLERAKYDRAKAVVTSPFDGMVDQVFVASGVRAGQGQDLVRVVNLGALRVDAQVLEHDLPMIQEGGQAIITSAAVGEKPIIGRIAAILPMVDSTTRAGRAIVRIPSNTVLRPGMYTDVRLEAVRLRNRRLVPTRAVIQRDNRPLVFVVRDGRAQWVYINAGRSNGTDTEVLPDSGSGLIPVEVGDQVIVEGHLTLTHDAPVRIVNVDTGATGSPIRKED